MQTTQKSRVNHLSDDTAGNATQIRYRSPLRYPGGKQKAIQSIADLLPKQVLEYREPMLGGGSVLFHARSVRLAEHYWVNDKFEDLVAFWRTVQNDKRCLKLMTELRQLHQSLGNAADAKRFFIDARKKAVKTEFERAFLFFFFNRVTFSGTTQAGGFSSAASINRFTLSSIERLAAMPQALADVRITNDDFAEMIKAPGNDVFIFLDPPYWTAQRLYGHNGSLHDFDHERLAKLLKKSDHQFLITYDDCAEIRQLYSWANVRQWELQYGMNNCNSRRLSKRGAELFITNY